MLFVKRSLREFGRVLEQTVSTILIFPCVVMHSQQEDSKIKEDGKNSRCYFVFLIDFVFANSRRFKPSGNQKNDVTVSVVNFAYCMKILFAMLCVVFSGVFSNF